MSIQSGIRLHLMVAVRMAPSGAPGFGDYRSANLRIAATLSLSGLGIAASKRLVTMFKITPNPPTIDPAAVTDPTSPYESPDSKKLNEAAERALDHYLGPPTARIMDIPYQPNRLYMANPQSDAESLLVDACETLGSASVMLNDFAGQLEGPRRKTLQGIAQIVMVAEMAVNQVVDKLVPTE
jgi:hypothetical protein